MHLKVTAAVKTPHRIEGYAIVSEDGMLANNNALFWNPAGASLDQALAVLGGPGASLGVIGGTEVFGMFLDRYDFFYLTRAPGVRLPGGRPVFPGVPEQTPEDVLAAHGLKGGPPHPLDRKNGVAVVKWHRDNGK